MSTYLRGFVASLLPLLLESGLLEIDEGSESQVIAFVGDRMATQSGNRQALSVLMEALVACEQVQEVWATDDELREAINDLGQR